jgi:hypothetical protein
MINMGGQRMIKTMLTYALIVLFVGTASACIPQTVPFSTSPKPTGQVELSYYGDIANSVGTCCPKWLGAIRLTQDEMAPYKEWTLTSIDAAADTGNGQSQVDIRIFIYDTGNETHPGSLIDNATTYHFEDFDFHIIPLVNTVPLAGHEDLWIAFEWNQSIDMSFIAPIDGGPYVRNKGSFVKFEPSPPNPEYDWEELYVASGGSIDGNFVIGGIIERNDDTELTILRLTGALPGLQAWISNIGLNPAYNVTWSITSKGGFMNSVNDYDDGFITSLDPAASSRISEGPFIGFGHITITITALADNVPKMTLTKNAFILGIFIIAIK